MFHYSAPLVIRILIMTINNNNYYYLELNKPADFVLETQLLCGFSTQKKMRNADFCVRGRYGEILSEFTRFLVVFFYGSCDKKNVFW